MTEPHDEFNMKVSGLRCLVCGESFPPNEWHECGVMKPPLNLQAIREREQDATKGPWFPRATDDQMFMNARYISTAPGEPKHDNLRGMAEGEAAFGEVVAVTLLQSPRLICHDSRKWDQNAEFIAHARADVPALLSVVSQMAAAMEKLPHTDTCDANPDWSPAKGPCTCGRDAALSLVKRET